MKIAKDRGRGLRLSVIGLAVLAATGTRPAGAQQGVDPRYQVPPPAPAPRTRTPGERTKPVDLRSIQVPGVQMKAIPVNPSDPICMVNGQPITRQQLADECVAKEGKKVLDAMINRRLIEQALARQKMAVTAAEIDEEIDAHRPAVRHRPRGLAPHPGQGARHQPVAVRPRDRLPGHRPAEALLRPGPGDAQGPPGSLRVAVRREAAGPDDPRGQAVQGDADLGGAAQEHRRHSRASPRSKSMDPGSKVAGRPAGRADHPARLPSEPQRQRLPATG